MILLNSYKILVLPTSSDNTFNCAFELSTDERKLFLKRPEDKKKVSFTTTNIGVAKFNIHCGFKCLR